MPTNSFIFYAAKLPIYFIIIMEPSHRGSYNRKIFDVFLLYREKYDLNPENLPADSQQKEFYCDICPDNGDESVSAIYCKICCTKLCAGHEQVIHCKPLSVMRISVVKLFHDFRSNMAVLLEPCYMSHV